MGLDDCLLSSWELPLKPQTKMLPALLCGETGRGLHGKAKEPLHLLEAHVPLWGLQGFILAASIFHNRSTHTALQLQCYVNVLLHHESVPPQGMNAMFGRPEGYPWLLCRVSLQISSL